MIPTEIVVGVILLWLLYSIVRYKARAESLRRENDELRAKNDDLNERIGRLAENIVAEDARAKADPGTKPG